ncbi:MAG: hypothetical protein LBJ61_07505 [Deltaproteobacteria bacterium]|jgi:hypothetical protein|nr:hypothetical protein [Deltaproteobacteria bacterium]
MGAIDSRTGPGPAPALRPGVTLVELLVVVALAMMVAGVAFSLHALNSQSYFREDAYIHQQQNLRAALYFLSRDLRMAGNGLKILGPEVKLVQAWTPSRQKFTGGVVGMEYSPGWFSHPDSTAPGFRSIFGVDGGAELPDTVTAFRSEVEYPTPLGLVSAYEDSLHRLVLVETIKDNVIKPGDIVALVNGTVACILETESISNVNIDIKAGGRFTSPDGLPPGFPVVGATVYNLRDVVLNTYYIDAANNRLLVSPHDSSKTGNADFGFATVVANNVEDLQLYYFIDDQVVDLAMLEHDPVIGSDALDNHAVKVVGVGLTALSGYGDGSPMRYRPKLFNRNAGTITDKNRRSYLAEFIYLRNYP